MLFSSILSAQAPIFFTNTFDTPPTLAATETAGAWYPDRYPPTIFEQYNFNGENVLHVGIRLADAYWNRPLVNHNTFSNTQGRKFDLSSGNGFGTALIADLYVGADWNTNHRMATLWSSACDSTGANVINNYVGFRNSTGSDPGFYVFGYHNTGGYTLLPYAVTYGQWYSLKIDLTDTAFVYSINGTVVLSDDSLSGTKYFSNLILEAYNFADSTLTTDPSPAYEEYDVYWDNVGAMREPTVYSNPAPVDLGAAGTYRALAGTDLTVGATCTVHGNVGGVNSVTVNTGGSVTGTTDIANPAATAGFNALTAAISAVQSRIADSTLTVVDLGGMLLGRGVYVGTGTLGITGTLTLHGTATDTFIIRTGSPGTSLITSANSIVALTGGALASNVIWQTGSSAELGASSTFKGIILAGTTIVQDANASFDGRAMAQTTVLLNGPSVLPVELVSFTATASGMNANLHWSTATEINNSGFEIQRRQTSDWAKVGFVAGAGTSNAPRNYSYTDSKLSAGSYSYRLKQIDNNGAFTYGSTVEVAISSTPAAFALSQNYPNPFNPSTVISYQLPVNSRVTLKVYDMLGQEVATLVNGPQEAGVYTVSFNTSKGTPGLSSGVYIYRLEAGSFVSTKKLVLMR